MKKAFNKVSFEEFIRNHMIPLATKPYTLIMDNLSIHKNKACLELLKKHHIEVIFQPPYSPEYNPIELQDEYVSNAHSLISQSLHYF